MLHLREGGTQEVRRRERVERHTADDEGMVIMNGDRMMKSGECAILHRRENLQEARAFAHSTRDEKQPLTLQAAQRRLASIGSIRFGSFSAGLGRKS